MSVQRFANAPHGGKIRVELAPALETLYKLAAAQHSFDLVFINAKKTEYVQYFKILLDDNLLSANGFVCVDNTLLQGQVYLPPQEQVKNGEAIACFNRIIKDDPEIEQVLLLIRDELTIPKVSVGKQRSKGKSASVYLLNL